ncbi:MAG: hypothetical protein JOZ90_10870 [Alphaproteobacteria bacterium]|nr:hypothetical protein [Alphaproteobacteria bacterium]MBV9371039.1 hypothetical protein [Alphaproteobacteria bacterium]MBV9901587.1 hypothetical protein [Alphaproteobacteria bacterium]
MRPTSIRVFEGLSLLAVAMGAVTTFLTWDSLVASVRSKVLGAGLEPALMVLSLIYVGLLVLLILLTARRGSMVAKWLFVAIIAAELVFTVPRLGAMAGAGAIGWLEIVQLLIQLVAVGALFTPPSRAWFAQWRAPGARPAV